MGAARVSISVGQIKVNPLLTNKGYVKKEDRASFVALTPDPKEKINLSMSSPFSNVKEKWKKRKQATVTVLHKRTRNKSQFKSIEEKSLNWCKPVKIFDKITSLRLSSNPRETSGYEVSFKDIDKFLRSPERDPIRQNNIPISFEYFNN